MAFETYAEKICIGDLRGAKISAASKENNPRMAASVARLCLLKASKRLRHLHHHGVILREYNGRAGGVGMAAWRAEARRVKSRLIQLPRTEGCVEL